MEHREYYGKGGFRERPCDLGIVRASGDRSASWLASSYPLPRPESGGDRYCITDLWLYTIMCVYNHVCITAPSCSRPLSSTAAAQEGVGKLAAWFVQDPVVPDSKKLMSNNKKTKNATIISFSITGVQFQRRHLSLPASIILSYLTLYTAIQT